MKMNELFAAELEREAEGTRRVLERVPEGRDDWKPHPRSMPLGQLARLVASMPSWIPMVIEMDELDIAPEGGKKNGNPKYTTVKDLLKEHEEGVAKAKSALKTVSEDHLQKIWKLKAGGHVMDEKPRHIMIRDGVLNHLAHHRGQLTVYLRLNEAKVPPVYGPTADEQ
jgi:uncharacterized damage-inducible protein DinB